MVVNKKPVPDPRRLLAFLIKKRRNR